jgi:hypothetical protein
VATFWSSWDCPLGHSTSTATTASVPSPNQAFGASCEHHPSPPPETWRLQRRVAEVTLTVAPAARPPRDAATRARQARSSLAFDPVWHAEVERNQSLGEGFDLHNVAM